MQRLLSPRVVYAPDDVDAALARVFGPGVRPLRVEDALFEATLAGWRSQQAARLLKAKTVRANEATVRATGAWPWQWRASDANEFFEDLLAAAAADADDTASQGSQVRTRKCVVHAYSSAKAGASSTPVRTTACRPERASRQ